VKGQRVAPDGWTGWEVTIARPPRLVLCLSLSAIRLSIGGYVKEILRIANKSLSFDRFLCYHECGVNLIQH
jgi:hypothetical protein